MKVLFQITILVLLQTNSSFFAQDFSGTYTMQEYGETITLNLSQDSDGNLNGTMSSEGIEHTINGQPQGNKITGSMDAFGESMKFSAQFINDNLELTLYDPKDEQGEYNEYAETLVFQRLKQKTKIGQSEKATTGKSKAYRADENVIINGIVLNEKQITELEKNYTVKPLPGSYWYDARSGLYGVVGYPAYGFMLPGHDLGELESNASKGDAGVFVNGRELPQTEWAVWSQLLGYIIQPGRYWLDEKGNAGYEGNPTPTDNLYLAAQRNSYKGSGSGGDKIWSTRFGAGNYDSGNQRGYVSVPGHGPIEYGF